MMVMANQASRRHRLQKIELVEEEHQSRATHAGLWLDRYLLQQEIEIKESTTSEQSRGKQHGEQKDGRTNPRSKHVKEVSLLPVPVAYQQFFQHWKEELGAFGAVSYEAKVRGRMVIGLG